MGTTGVPLAPEHWGELRRLGVWSDPILGGPGRNRAEMNPDMRARAAEKVTGREICELMRGWAQVWPDKFIKRSRLRGCNRPWPSGMEPPVLSGLRIPKRGSWERVGECGVPSQRIPASFSSRGQAFGVLAAQSRGNDPDTGPKQDLCFLLPRFHKTPFSGRFHTLEYNPQKPMLGGQEWWMSLFQQTFTPQPSLRITGK